MWSGSSAPPGWYLCDGAMGTPDLRGRFIVSISKNETDIPTREKADQAYEYGNTGGINSYKLIEDEMPSHIHSAVLAGEHTHTVTEKVGEEHTHPYVDTSSNFQTEGTDQRGWPSGHSNKDTTKHTLASTNLKLEASTEISHSYY